MKPDQWEPDERPMQPLPPFDGDSRFTFNYATKKNIAQGMMDIALLTANASQLRYVMRSPYWDIYHKVNITLISISIVLQVIRHYFTSSPQQISRTSTWGKSCWKLIEKCLMTFLSWRAFNTKLESAQVLTFRFTDCCWCGADIRRPLRFQASGRAETNTDNEQCSCGPHLHHHRSEHIHSHLWCRWRAHHINEMDQRPRRNNYTSARPAIRTRSVKWMQRLHSSKGATSMGKCISTINNDIFGGNWIRRPKSNKDELGIL